MAIILITGASRGIGYQTAELLAQNGHKVYGAARRMDKLEKLKSVGVEPIYLDITNEESCRKLVDTIIDNEGQIDILIMRVMVLMGQSKMFRLKRPNVNLR